MKLVASATFVVAIAACNDPNAGGASSSAPSGPPPELAAPSATPPIALPKAVSFVRTASPSERFKKDEAGCAGGDKTACRALARRYSGTGPFAGCGVPRERAAPSVKRAPTDAAKDRLPFAGGFLPGLLDIGPREQAAFEPFQAQGALRLRVVAVELQHFEPVGPRFGRQVEFAAPVGHCPMLVGRVDHLFAALPIRVERLVGGDVLRHVLGGAPATFPLDEPRLPAGRRELGRIWKSLMGDHYPAMSMIFVADLLDTPAKIELEATAVVPAA